MNGLAVQRTASLAHPVNDGNPGSREAGGVTCGRGRCSPATVPLATGSLLDPRRESVVIEGLSPLFRCAEIGLAPHGLGRLLLLNPSSGRATGYCRLSSYLHHRALGELHAALVEAVLR